MSLCIRHGWFILEVKYVTKFVLQSLAAILGTVKPESEEVSEKIRSAGKKACLIHSGMSLLYYMKVIMPDNSEVDFELLNLSLN